MTQSKTDSFMEAASNTAIGFVLSMVTWQLVAFGFGIPMPIGENLKITGIFTVVSLTRSYLIRRIFNGRPVWAVLKSQIASSPPSEGQLIKGN